MTPQPYLEPPAWLQGRGLEEWNRVLPDLLAKGLEALDSAALATYCHTFGEWVRCEEDILKQGRTFETPQGVLRAHPLLRHSLQLLSELRRLGRDFGLTPGSRKKPGGESDKLDEDIRELLGAGQ